MTTMKKYRSNRERRYAEWDLENVEKSRVWSADDGTSVVALTCGVCGVSFQEEYEMARAKAILSQDYLCILCDPGAENAGPKTTQYGLLVYWANM